MITIKEIKEGMRNGVFGYSIQDNIVIIRQGVEEIAYILLDKADLRSTIKRDLMDLEYEGTVNKSFERDYKEALDAYIDKLANAGWETRYTRNLSNVSISISHKNTKLEIVAPFDFLRSQTFGWVTIKCKEKTIWSNTYTSANTILKDLLSNPETAVDKIKTSDNKSKELLDKFWATLALD